MISYRKLAMRVLGHSPVSAVKTARRSTAKRTVALALTAALVVGMTLPAFAGTWYIENGDISISAGENGNKVTQGGKTKENDTDTVITNRDSSTASSNTVTIDADEGKTVNVTLDNVTINVDEGYKYGYDPNAYKTAVSVTGSGNTNIELNGNNTLTSGYGHAGLEHNKTDDSGTLTIQDEKNDDGSAKGSASDTTGSLTATGGYHSAGIGGSDKQDGQVTITGGEIIANGGSQGAGIGGGAGNQNAVGGDGDVTISGGTITATGGSLGAGIGGGAYGNGTVTVTDGDITAKATGNYGAGIGGGFGAIPKDTLIGGNGTVTISGGTITEASGGYMAAGIGSGYQGLGTVTIEGDAVIKNAQGGEAGAGIGSGTYGDSEIIIRGDAVIENAESSGNGAGIGSGQGDLYPDGDGMVIDPTVGNVTIEGNAKIENAKSGYGGSGIGGGTIGIGNVIIRGNAQIGNATGGEEGAGIGGGQGGSGSNITISDGKVTATGAGAGAGIGGGYEGSGKSITIEGGEVTAQGDAGGAGIGGGISGTGSDVTISGDAQVKVQGGTTGRDWHKGAAIGNGGTPTTDGNEVSPNTSDLKVGGFIQIYEPGKNINTDTPDRTIEGQKGDHSWNAGEVTTAETVPESKAAAYWVSDSEGRSIPYQSQVKDGVLTVTVQADTASLRGTTGSLRQLEAQGITEIRFVTNGAQSDFTLSDLLTSGTGSFTLTHDGDKVTFTLENTDISGILK